MRHEVTIRTWDKWDTNYTVKRIRKDSKKSFQLFIDLKARINKKEVSTKYILIITNNIT